MELKKAGIVAALMLGTLSSAALAQNPAPPANSARQVNVSRLPINIQRIQRELRQAAIEREEQDGLNLRYQIEVYGRAPEIKLFTPDDNLTTGPVPYGAPTHREFVEHLTPREYRPPVMDFNALFKWLAEKAK